MNTLTSNILVIITILGCLTILFSKTVRTSDNWHATVTPLASIIGSGFLVSAPLLLLATGKWALIVMCMIVLVAYALGSSLRYNIVYIEPLLQQPSNNQWIYHIENLSKPALGLAYVITVAFYLKLLSAFVLRGIAVDSILLENILTTALLLLIGLTGWLRGLSMLEMFEIISVNAKLSIIAALIVGHLYFNYALISQSEWILKAYPHESIWAALRKVLGILVIIQGFETSRYLGHAYSRELRVKTMRQAQLLSGVIYVVFVATTMVVFNDIHEISETTVIDLCLKIAPILPVLLIIAAAMSQFSAAVADTVGSGGLLSEAVRNKISINHCYLIVVVIAITLTWLTNIAEIIAIASKAFAFYYGLQLLLAMIGISHQQGEYRFIKLGLYSLLFIIMLATILFGVPVK